jgi:putative ABC transport system substrate-binding protein
VTRSLSRRAFASGLAALAAGTAIAFKSNVARAQQPAAPRRIGVLLVGSSPEGMQAQAFREGLRNADYTEGRDVIVEWRTANGDYDRVPALVAELVQGKVDVIVADSTVATQSLKNATSTIPIVMAMVSDPVGSGLVANLARPGGNITGLSLMNVELSAKRLQLLKEVVPKLARVAVLSTPARPTSKRFKPCRRPRNLWVSVSLT